MVHERQEDDITVSSNAVSDTYKEKRRASSSSVGSERSQDYIQNGENDISESRNEHGTGKNGKKNRLDQGEAEEKYEDELDDEDDEIERNEDGEKHDLEKVATTRTKHSVNSVSQIPNGGLWAWLQVLGAFFLFFNSWGIINTFGSYQTYYETELLADSSPSAISWIGSIQAFLLLVVGVLTGPIYDAGYFRELLWAGSFLLVLGQMMLSLCTKYWQVLLAQAFCMGIGTSMLFIPSVAILSTYFTTRIATAMGFAASGSSIGGVIYPIVFHKLSPTIGFAWTARVLGFLILVTQLVPILCMRVRVLPSSTRSLLDLSAFRNPAFTLDVTGFAIGFVGLYMPFFYAQVYAIETGITNPDLGFYLLAVMNGLSTFGRILPNVLADKIGPFNVAVPCALMSAILCYCYISVSSTAGIIVLMAFYGFFSGSFVSLPPTIIIALSADARSKIGTRLGMNFTFLSFGVLIGTPIGGAIKSASGGYAAVWAFGGSVLIISTIMLCAARVCWKGWGLKVKA